MASADPPNLAYPYFPEAEILWEKKKELEQRRKERGPEREAQLKAAREQYAAKLKKERERK